MMWSYQFGSCDDFLMTNEPLGGASGATQLWNDHISFNGIIQWTSWPLNCEMITFYLMILLSNWPLNCDMITSYLMMWSYRPTGWSFHPMELNATPRRTPRICSLRRAWRFAPHVKMHVGIGGEVSSFPLTKQRTNIVSLFVCWHQPVDLRRAPPQVKRDFFSTVALINCLSIRWPHKSLISAK